MSEGQVKQVSGHADGHGHAPFSALALAALGVVFGDIGTSPLYTLKECLHASGHGAGNLEGNVFGLLSLIFWSLTMVVTVKYITFIMRADYKGEGGIFALLALVPEPIRQTANKRPTDRGEMGWLAETIFSILQRHSLGADRSFGVPPHLAFEVGLQLDL